VEDEFEAFGRHVGLKLKSMPVLLAFDAQEQILVYLNRLRRQHLQNPSEQNIFTRSITPSVSPYTQKDSPPSSTSTSSYYNSQVHEETECSQTQQYPLEYNTIMQDILSTLMIPSYEEGSQSNTTTNDIIATAINNANVKF